MPVSCFVIYWRSFFLKKKICLVTCYSIYKQISTSEVFMNQNCSPVRQRCKVSTRKVLSTEASQDFPKLVNFITKISFNLYFFFCKAQIYIYLEQYSKKRRYFSVWLRYFFLFLLKVDTNFELNVRNQIAHFEEQLWCLSEKRLDKWKVQFFTFCCQSRAVDDEVGAFTPADEGDTHCLL